MNSMSASLAEVENDAWLLPSGLAIIKLPATTELRSQLPNGDTRDRKVVPREILDHDAQTGAYT